MWIGFPQKAEQLEEGSQPALHPRTSGCPRTRVTTGTSCVLQGQDKALLTSPEVPSASECLLHPEFSTADPLAGLPYLQ